MLFSITACLAVAWFPLSSESFVVPTSTLRHSTTNTALNAADASSLIVISPPSGVGEVTAVKAAEMGTNVRWFVVSNNDEDDSNSKPTSPTKVSLSQETVDSIVAAGGRVDVAGASAKSLLDGGDESARSAVTAWCKGVIDDSSTGLICCYDGVMPTLGKTQKKLTETQEMNVDLWKNAIKVAAKEASLSLASHTGTRVAVLSATDATDDDDDDDEDNSDDEEGGGGLGSIVGGLFGGKDVTIPSTLTQAIKTGYDNDSVVVVRHGQLFGIPESSPDFSPLMGGPRREAELCQEYTMRTVRVDPTLSVSGNYMMGGTTQSCRHAIGEAAALVGLERLPLPAITKGSQNLDLSISSQLGTDPMNLARWTAEFTRVEEIYEASLLSSSQLFTAEFGTVPDINRFTDWLSTKWAPTVLLRTFDLAAIRIGARPVYARKIDEQTVEIVWQKLVEMESVTCGTMRITVNEDGLVAERGAGDASRGFGKVRRKPLKGENVLVRSLAEACSQAIEKGLATKPKVEEPEPEPVVAAVPATPAAVTTLKSSGDVVQQEDAATTSRTGPRRAGARRSQQRERGGGSSRRRKSSRSSSEDEKKEG